MNRCMPYAAVVYIALSAVLLWPSNAKADCAPPTIGAPSITFDELSRTVLTVSYSFPADAGDLGRVVWVTFNAGAPSEHTIRGPASGTLVFDPGWFCLPKGVEQQVRVQAQYGLSGFQCRGMSPASDVKQTTFTNTTPKITGVSVEGPGADEIAKVTVSYEFRFTRSQDIQRTIRIIRTDTGQVLTGAEQNLPAIGSVTMQFSTRCLPPGTYPLTIKAISCRAAHEGDPLFEDSRSASITVPTVDDKVVPSLRYIPERGKLEATVRYDFPVSGTRTIGLSVTKWIDNQGEPHDGYALPGASFTAPSLSGTLQPPYEFDPPSGARFITIRATASRCTGASEGEASTECPGCGNAVGDPVSTVDGNVRYSDRDPLPALPGAGSLSRTWDSAEGASRLFGHGWTSFLDRRLVTFASAEGQSVALTNESGEVVIFRGPISGPFRQVWPRDTTLHPSLTYDGTNGVYTVRPEVGTLTSRFRASDGRFIGWRDLRTGRETTIAWDAANLPVSATDSVSGLAWTFATDATSRRVISISVSGPPSLTWTYQYDGTGNLQTVLINNDTWRTYEYLSSRMTAARDAAGNTIETHTYDAFGRGTSSHGPSDEIASIAYGLAGTNAGETVTRVTTSAGAVADYVLKAAGGGWRTLKLSGVCSSCGSRDSVYVYDRNGHVTRMQDSSGYVTVSTYAGDRLATTQQFLKPAGCDPETDANRCRLDQVTLASTALDATSATLPASSLYGDANWPDRVTDIAMPSVLASGRLRRAQFTYHPITGEIVSETIWGWRDNDGETIDEQHITHTLLYGDVVGGGDDADGGVVPVDPHAPAFDPGGSFLSAWLALPQPQLLRKSVDGPRTEVEDVTSYVYYPIDPTVPATLRGRLAASKDAVGLVTRIEAYDVFGNAARIVDANGVATEATFDGLGRPLTTTVKGISGCDTTADPLCATDLVAARTYVAAGPVDHEQRPGGGVTSYTYDSRGRVASIARGPSTTDLREKIDFTYDTISGKKTLEVYFAKEGTSWVEKKRESFTYDSLGQLSTMVHADNTSIGYSYRSDGKLSGIRDENHATPNTTYAYDPAGRTKSVTQKLGTGIIVTSYAYDLQGNLVSVTDPNGNVTSYIYDDFGQMMKQESLVTGVTTYGYDAGGNLTSTMDANGATTERTYDMLGRVLTAESSRTGATSETVTWVYDDATAGRYAKGRLSSMEDPEGITSYWYERRGLLTVEKREVPDWSTWQTGYAWDADANRKTVVYPSSLDQVSYTFDYAGRPLSATAWQAFDTPVTTTIVSEARYLPFGSLKFLQFGNGTNQTMIYDNRYRIDVNTLTGPGGTIAQYDYGHDNTGNVDSIHDVVEPAYDRSFTYDDLNRLKTATNPLSSPLWRSLAYSYDAMGNATTIAYGAKIEDDGDVVGSRTIAFTHEGTTARISTVTEGGIPTSVLHDNAGNLTEFVATRTYSPRNLFSSVQDVRETPPDRDGGEPALAPHRLEYGYDGRGVRVRRKESPSDDTGTSATRFYFYSPDFRLLANTLDSGSNVWNPVPTPGGGHPRQDVNASPVASIFDPNGIVAEYVWFGDRPIAQMSPTSPGLRYTFADHLGTPMLQTNDTGTVIWRVEHEPFGNVYLTRVGNRTDQILRFPGQESAIAWDGKEENYNIFRWYRSGWGRYTQADPVGLSAGTNLYTYGLNSPLIYTDRLGRKPVTDNNRYVTATQATIMCDGRGNVVPFIGERFFRSQVERKCLYDCILMHEISHVNESVILDSKICKGKRGGLIVGNDDAKQVYAGERRAFLITIRCLERLKPCKECDGIVDNAVEFYTNLLLSGNIVGRE